MDKQPTYLRITILLAIFGLIGLMSAISNPVFANIRPVHLIHLIASGGCFGAAFMALGAYFQERRSMAEKKEEK